MEGKQYKVTIRGNNIYTDGDFRFDEKPQKDFFDKVIIEYTYEDDYHYKVNEYMFVGSWRRCVEFLQKSCHTLIKAIDGRYFDISGCLVTLGKIIEWCHKSDYSDVVDDFEKKWSVDFTGNADGSIVFVFEEMPNNDKLKNDTKDYIKTRGKDLRLSQLMNTINTTDRIRISFTNISYVGSYSYKMVNKKVLYEGNATVFQRVSDKYKDYIVHQIAYDNEALEIYIYDIQDDQKEEEKE